MPSAGSLLRPLQSGGTDRFQTLPDVALEGQAAESRQIAAQVNNKRTPTGNFFTTINPTLYEKQSPPATYKGQCVSADAIGTLRPGAFAWQRGASNEASPHGEDAAGSAYPGASLRGSGSLGASGRSSGGAGMEGTAAAAEQPSWRLPWQTGDRALGRAMAEAVRHKRTPIGAFAQRDLAKPNK